MDKGRLKTLCKTSLMQITELDQQALSALTDEQMALYTVAISSISKVFPIHKGMIEIAFTEGDYSQMLSGLQTLRSDLGRIYAKSLASDCERLIIANEDVSKIRKERLDVALKYLLSTVSLLFTDIKNLFETLSKEDEEYAEDESEIQNIIKEKIKQITEINSDEIDKLNATEVTETVEKLGSFKKEFLAREKALKGAIHIRNHQVALKHMEGIRDLLYTIKANDLAEDLDSNIAQNGDGSQIRHERFEMFVNYILSSISVLCDDIDKIELPKRIAELVVEKQEIESVEVLLAGGSPNSPCIVVANKTRFFLENLKVVLANSGNKIVGTTKSKAIIEFMRNNKVDLFILDDDMPDISGFELSKAIRKAGLNAPIILLTKTMTKEYAVSAMSVGINDFMIKPIDIKNVQSKVDKFLK